MADTDRFGGSDRDYAYTDYSGRQGLDVRNPGDYAIQRAHSYPSNRQPLLNQPPMEGPPQRPHVNPRMRHINPRGMNKTVDPLYNLMAQQAGAFGGSQSYGGTGRPQQEMPRRLGPPSNIGYDRMGGGLGGPPSNIGYDRMGEELGGIGGLQEQAAVDPSDWRTILKILEAGGDPGTETQSAGIMGVMPGEYETSGLWQTWKKILERTGNENLANQWLEAQQAV